MITQEKVNKQSQAQSQGKSLGLYSKRLSFKLDAASKIAENLSFSNGTKISYGSVF